MRRVKNDRGSHVFRFVWIWFALVGEGVATGDVPLDALVQLSQLNGEEYRVLRDELLQRHDQPSDVRAAAAHSWEAGLAALAFNARRNAPETINKWESRPRVLSARGTTFDISPSNAQIAVPWQLESLWQAPGAKPKVIWNFEQSFHSGWRIHAPAELWLSIWSNAGNEDLRKVAIYGLAVSGDPSTSGTILGLLKDRASDPVYRYVCLLGLRFRDARDTTSLVLDAWDAIVEAGYAEVAIIVLAVHGDAAGRARLHEVADDPAYTEMDRVKSVVVLGSNPQPGDADQFVRFLKSDVAVSAKKDALYRAKRWPLENLRPAVRYVLENETDRGVISEAMAALARCHLHADPMGTATDPETPEDIRLIDAAIERIGSPEGMKRSRDFCVRTIEGYRGPLVGDKWPWERHAPKP